MRHHDSGSGIDAVADAYTAQLAGLCPAAATGWGIGGHDDRVGDFSPDSHAERDALNARTLRALDRAEQQAEEVRADEHVTLAAMRDRLGLERELYAAGEYRADMNNVRSPVQTIRAVFDLMPTATVEDWELVATRLEDVPAAIDGYVACLREGLVDGPRPTQRQAVAGLVEAEALAHPSQSFFRGFSAGAQPTAGGASPALGERLERAGGDAIAAYERLTTVVREEVLPGAPVEDAVGRERYARFSHGFVGARVDLEEAYAWGLEMLGDLLVDQQRLADRILASTEASAGVRPWATRSTDAVRRAIEVLNADPDRQLRGPEELREWMQQVSDEAIEALAGSQFTIPEPLRRLEARIAPTSSGRVNYTPPSEDFSRPGRMWWSVPQGVRTFATWRERTTVYHEGVPGHHLQMGTAIAAQDSLNDWRRLVSWTSGHAEGWALYAEQLMADLGFHEDLGDRFGMLDAQVLRAARVVFDIGVHLRLPAPQAYGGGTWEASKGWELLHRNLGKGDAALRYEWQRYLTWPGQAPSYLLGRREWEDLRAVAAEAARARGEVFSLRDFHARALSLGSLPLGVLRQAMSAI